METLRKITSSIVRFFRNYTPADIAATLKRLIENLLDSISESGNGFIKILLSFLLVPLIIALAFVLLTKNFFRYFWRFIKYIYHLFKQWVNLTLKEINFYIEKLATASRNFGEAWNQVFELGAATAHFLVAKIADDDASFDHIPPDNSRSMVVNTAKVTGIWIFWFFVSFIMVIFLAITAIFMIPLLHRWLRLKSFAQQSEDDSFNPDNGDVIIDD